MKLRNTKIAEKIAQALKFIAGDGHRVIFCLRGGTRHSVLFIRFPRDR